MQHLNFTRKLYQAQALQIMSLNAIHQFFPSVLLYWCHLQGEKHSQVCSFLGCKPHLFAGSPASGKILELGQVESGLFGNHTFPPGFQPEISPWNAPWALLRRIVENWERMLNGCKNHIYFENCLIDHGAYLCHLNYMQMVLWLLYVQWSYTGYRKTLKSNFLFSCCLGWFRAKLFLFDVLCCFFPFYTICQSVIKHNSDYEFLLKSMYWLPTGYGIKSKCLAVKPIYDLNPVYLCSQIS